ncbi:MAG: tetratricopeptide repeat protein [Verrucomicrobia bacterium]|nr:tetratricopeptide repeat protein [Verrucomicrobiota bacterium]MDA1065977.1 tetratricopeptide repeat protein [Verrucomicrobiota bacterium]
MPEEKHRPSDSEDKPPLGLAAFWAELKRRKVMRVAITYAVVAWLVIQIAVSTFPSLYIPQWALSLVIMCVLLGFPVAIILAWAFELTPDGIKTTRHAREEQGAIPLSAGQQKKRNWMAYLVGALIPTLIFGTLALVFYFQAKPEQEPQEPLTNNLITQSTEKSIAVLPLANMSPDPENAFFADGVHEDVLTNLSRIKDLLVIGRTSTLQYRDTVKTLQQIGEELGVRYLVEGSVRRARNHVLVTVQLIDAQTEGHLWAENYSRELDDIFAIQAEVAKAIAGQLKAVLSPEEIEKIEYRPTENQDAYDLFLKYRLSWKTTRFDLEEKIPLLEKAVALDPAFGEAWANLAADYLVRSQRSRRNPADSLNKAHEALAKTQTLIPDSAPLKYAQACFEDIENQNLEGAIKLLLNALSIDPSAYEAKRYLCRLYYVAGRLEEAIFLAETILRSDPLDKLTETQLMMNHIGLGMWDRARQFFNKHDEKAGALLVDYLQYGSRKAFLEYSEYNSTPNPRDSIDNSWVQVIQALVNRDLDIAKSGYDDWQFSRFRFFLNGEGVLSIRRELLMALIHFELGEMDEITSLIDSSKRVIETEDFEDPRGHGERAIWFALMNEPDRVEQEVSRIREITAKPYWKYLRQEECEMYIAICYLVLGNNDKALEILEAASNTKGAGFINRELDLWFIFDRLRGNPRFDALLED